jgi:predicted small integral membrane protein
MWLRLSKIALVASIALTCSLVALGNIVDPNLNLAFVQHVLSMDTIPSDHSIHDRAIINPELQWLAFILIVLGETLAALLLWLGAAQMLWHVTEDGPGFARAKASAVVGLSIGFLIWQAGFLGIGGEWFGMWMSKTWNGQESAFRFAMMVLGVLIYLVQPD